MAQCMQGCNTSTASRPHASPRQSTSLPPHMDSPMPNPFQQPARAPSSAGSGTDACDCSTCDTPGAAPQEGGKVARRSLDKGRRACFSITPDPTSPSGPSSASGQNTQQQQQLDTGQAASSCKNCGKEQPEGRRSGFAGSTCEACSWQGQNDQHPIVRGVAASSMSESEFKLRVRQTGPPQLPQPLELSKSSSISSEQAEVLRQTWSGLTHYSLECPDDEVRRAHA